MASDPGSSLRGLTSVLNWQIRQVKTPAGRRHLEAALACVRRAMQAEGESGPQVGRREYTGDRR